MASPLEELIGDTVVDGAGNPVPVQSLAGADKVVGKWANLSHHMFFHHLWYQGPCIH